MFKVTVIGHFGYGLEYFDGQTVKTKKVTNELIRQFGEKNIKTIDTHGGLKTLLRAPVDIFSCAANSENIVVLPAQNGLKVYAPLIRLAKRFHRVKTHYVVIGGWVGGFLEKSKRLRKNVSFFDGIYVETNTMKRSLESMGLNNIYVLPNFKENQPTQKNDFALSSPYPLCTFSRVMKQKGIEDAVKAVNYINKSKNRQAFSLDIYGPVDKQETEWFEKLKKEFGDCIKYKGSVRSSESSKVLGSYFALLLPTHFFTEGIPGTIIDAYAAGVPVICSKWKNFSDVVDDNVTGIGYEFDSQDGLLKALEYIADNPEVLLNMRNNCLEKFKNYLPEEAMQPLISRM